MDHDVSKTGNLFKPQLLDGEKTSRILSKDFSMPLETIDNIC
jgi:hypothetical protein